MEFVHTGHSNNSWTLLAAVMLDLTVTRLVFFTSPISGSSEFSGDGSITSDKSCMSAQWILPDAISQLKQQKWLLLQP